jgi:hypothetical protein
MTVDKTISARPAPLRTALVRGQRFSEDEGNKAFHVPLIRRVLVREFLEHEFFLVPQFDPNAHKHQRHRDDSSHVPEYDHSCDEHRQEPGVNRMTH